jgi:hypothetical protein
MAKKKSNFQKRVAEADQGFKNFNKKVNDFDAKSRKNAEDLDKKFGTQIK